MNRCTSALLKSPETAKILYKPPETSRNPVFLKNRVSVTVSLTVPLPVSFT
ncbi:hypothetical protein [[Phormidium] sp. ETS-05]|uniref:hypothetical protein n=1 Tax=[Phormidium] sp. ETS-05 TaxID=222819 RepID=UPI0018EEEF99|nr:hypothetical protein [[Phormidium] sp. ETS-05]